MAKALENPLEPGAAETDQPPTTKRLALLSLAALGVVYGDSTITPAISVLSSVEGLEMATPFFKPYIVPITIVILVLLFSFQRQGTRIVGSVFGLVML